MAAIDQAVNAIVARCLGLREGEELAPLREREDFRKLVQEIDPKPDPRGMRK